MKCDLNKYCYDFVERKENRYVEHLKSWSRGTHLGKP